MEPLVCTCGKLLPWDAFHETRALVGVVCAINAHAARTQPAAAARDWDALDATTAAAEDAAALPLQAAFDVAGVPPSRPCCRAVLTTAVDRTLDHAIARALATEGAVTHLARAPRSIAYVTSPPPLPGRGHPVEAPLPRRHAPHPAIAAQHRDNAAWIATVSAAAARPQDPSVQ